MNAGQNVNGRYRNLMCDVIRELVKAPRTVSELRQLCEMSSNSLRDLLDILVSGGLLHVEEIPALRGGNPARRYHWCPRPFEVPETVGQK